MFEATDSEWAPWYVVETNDKQRGRLNLITHLLSLVPYEPITPKGVVLPERQVESTDFARVGGQHIPTPF
jgi:hypothetical protein